LIAWLNPAATNAWAMVDNDTLLLAANLNFSQAPNSPALVARSGKTLDFCCNT
jgi:hypothetical protein